jgi:hypothetical protein
VNQTEKKEQLTHNCIRRPQLQFFISSKPLNDHGSIDIEVYLIALKSSIFNSLSKTFTTILCRKLSSREVLSGTKRMGESYRELFRDFLLEYNNGERWWYVLDSDETDNSSLANLFDTTKEKLRHLMVGAKLAQWIGESAKLKLLPDNIKSLCVEYDINIEVDKARLRSYNNDERRVICIGKDDGPLTARKQFSVDYPDPPRITPRRGFRRVLLDRLNRLLQTETETEEEVEEEEEKEEEEQQRQQESSVRAEELQNQQSIEQASYETKRDAILTNNFLLSVLGGSSFLHL